MPRSLIVVSLLASLALATQPALAQQGAQQGGHHHGGPPAATKPGPYAGQQHRGIKSLSDEDIAELRRGGGWGLARPAELNGVPGPAHLLELKKEIPLTDEQVAAIETIFKAMQKEAAAEGERLVEAERALDALFADRTVTDETLRQALAAAEASRTRLRYIHLKAHLDTPKLLTPEQIARYNELRGCGGGECPKAPPGHDPKMWRQHNNCR